MSEKIVVEVKFYNGATDCGFNTAKTYTYLAPKSAKVGDIYVAHVRKDGAALVKITNVDVPQKFHTTKNLLVKVPMNKITKWNEQQEKRKEIEAKIEQLKGKIDKKRERQMLLTVYPELAPLYEELDKFM